MHKTFTYKTTPDPLALYQILKGNENSFLFESADKCGEIGRFTLMGTHPLLELKARDNQVIIQKSGHEVVLKGNPFDVITQLLIGGGHTLGDLPFSSGGLAGYLGYDSIRHIENISDQEKTGDFDDIHLMLPQHLIIIDREKSRVELIVLQIEESLDELKGEKKPDTDTSKLVDTLKNYINGGLNVSPPIKSNEELDENICKLKAGSDICVESWTSEMTEDKFKQGVKTAKEHIKKGDSFQIVLSRRLSKKTDLNALELYQTLRHINPSPYMFVLDLGETQVVGASPETMVNLTGNLVTIHPIAGTRPRGQTLEEDVQNEKKLIEDVKENAEHLMLVDLARNDIGRISAYGTVQVPKFKTIERFSHVMHIVSEVTGQVDKEKSAIDVFKACFPAGTVSGAPKIKAMSIIENNEPVKRGLYAGAVGWIGTNGDMDTCIAIRTAVMKNGKVSVQAGAGIVQDSDPQAEFEETIHKSASIMRAVELAEFMKGEK